MKTSFFYLFHLRSFVNVSSALLRQAVFCMWYRYHPYKPSECWKDVSEQKKHVSQKSEALKETTFMLPESRMICRFQDKKLNIDL